MHIRTTEVSERADVKAQLWAPHEFTGESNGLLPYSTDDNISEITPPSAPDPEKLKHRIAFQR
jgi:hypothetical protein